MSHILLGHLRGQRSHRIVFVILVACMILIGTVYSSWVLLLSFVVLPTVLVWLFDKSDHPSLRIAVMGLNFLGILYAAYHSFLLYGLTPNVRVLLLDWRNLALPFGFPCLGWAIFLLLPYCMQAAMGLWLQYKEHSLKQEQNKLIETWGQKIKTPTHSPPLSQSSRGAIPSDTSPSPSPPPPPSPPPARSTPSPLSGDKARAG